MKCSLPFPAENLDNFLARPTPGLLNALPRMEGDFLLIGAGGKMGPNLALMLARGLQECGLKNTIHAVSRFSNPEARQILEEAGISVIAADVMDPDAVRRLPDAANVIFMAGQKFGTSSGPETTWAMNTLLPGRVAERYPKSRTVVFSTGCVYALSSAAEGGSTEESPLEPPGEYANSCIGRERVYEYYSRTHGTPSLLFRLNYAVDLRYGVLLDLAENLVAGNPIDVSMGHVNLIWQGDACARAIQSLELAGSPAVPLNVTGPETLSVRTLARKLAAYLEVEPTFTGQEADTAWLSNASRSFHHFGYPTVTVGEMLEWTAAWVKGGGKTLGKPTHFQSRDGKF